MSIELPVCVTRLLYVGSPLRPPSSQSGDLNLSFVAERILASRCFICFGLYLSDLKIEDFSVLRIRSNTITETIFALLRAKLDTGKTLTCSRRVFLEQTVYKEIG